MKEDRMKKNLKVKSSVVTHDMIQHNIIKSMSQNKVS